MPFRHRMSGMSNFKTSHGGNWNMTFLIMLLWCRHYEFITSIYKMRTCFLWMLTVSSVLMINCTSTVLDGFFSKEWEVVEMWAMLMYSCMFYHVQEEKEENCRQNSNPESESSVVFSNIINSFCVDLKLYS